MNINEYYNEQYDEDKRLNNNCDNRHKVEREVKKNIIFKLLEQKSSILEIGAGTGIYCLDFAKKGHNVYACDIVQKHVELIKEKSEQDNIKIYVECANALDLPYESEKFDMVLLSGPIYHLHDLQDKISAIKEALRCCKTGGYIVVDYLSDIHGYIQHVLLSNKFLLETNIENFDENIEIDKVFSYDNKKKIEKIMLGLGVADLKFYSTDSITRFIRDDINNLNNIEFEKWLAFINKISGNDSIVDLSEHCLAIGIKHTIE
ncbi:MAG: class I SAM-dependent methyltransferase [Bacilli bacterium]|nr:class I SAM-dependent methyltransferase [Bacilli bacterium]